MDESLKPRRRVAEQGDGYSRRRGAQDRDGSSPLMNTPVGRLTDQQWGWIFAGALFGWITTRCQQAIAEGLDQEEAVRLTGHTPSPAASRCRPLDPASIGRPSRHRLGGAVNDLVTRRP